MATQSHLYNRFRFQQLQYYAMPKIQTVISTVPTSIHRIILGLGKG